MVVWFKMKAVDDYTADNHPDIPDATFLDCNKGQIVEITGPLDGGFWAARFNDADGNIVEGAVPADPALFEPYQDLVSHQIQIKSAMQPKLVALGFTVPGETALGEWITAHKTNDNPSRDAMRTTLGERLGPNPDLGAIDNLVSWLFKLVERMAVKPMPVHAPALMGPANATDQEIDALIEQLQKKLCSDCGWNMRYAVSTNPSHAHRFL